MTRVRETIMRQDFPALFKRFFLAAVAVVILGGAAVGLSLQKQIVELGGHLRGGMELEGEFPEGLSITEPSVGAQVAFFIYGAVCLLLFLAYWLIVAAWLYQRAVVCGMHGLFWLLCGLWGNVFAAVVFVAIRSFTRQRCPECGKWQPVKSWYCSKCGTELKRSCAECGQTCGKEDQYCSRCGKPLEGDK